jgi:hypothetical protein
VFKLDVVRGHIGVLLKCRVSQRVSQRVAA